MAYTIIQSGSGLQFLNTDGGITTLTIPSSETLSQDVPPRWVIYGNYAILVNTPSHPLTIDATGTVRPLTPQAPKTGPILVAGSSGALSGTFKVVYTNIIQDVNGNIIAESDYSPQSNSVTISAQQLKVTGIEISSDPISARKLYRTTTNGTVFFPWLILDGNVLTQTQDDLSDAGLSIISAPVLGNPPRLIHIKEWRDRLWGVGDQDLDTLRYAEATSQWAWPASNGIIVPGSGRDQFGIRALMPRREALGVGRRDLIWQITGETPDDFQAVKLSEILGVESQETVVTFRDTVWWLWKDGVYQWDDSGMVNISDNRVKSWFSTDNYFNRDMFQFAFAVFDPKRLKYKLYLASAGSNQIDRWVEYDITTKTWWGPHKTLAFSPTSSFLIADANDKVRAIAGSQDGFIWQEQDLPTDGVSFGIEVDVITKFFNGSPQAQFQGQNVNNMTNSEKVWGELTVLGKVQNAGTMSITPTVGYINSSPSTPLFYDMTQGRQRLGRLGMGKLARLEFRHSTQAEPIELYGIELPFVMAGVR